MSEITQVLLELAIYFAIVGVVGVCTWVELKHEHAKRHQRGVFFGICSHRKAHSYFYRPTAP